MAEQVADFVLKRLRQWGIEHVYAYPGDGINGLVAAFGRADDQPQFIQTRHEEMAAFAATGYAKFSGRVGVCMATSGPGAITCSTVCTTPSSTTCPSSPSWVWWETLERQSMLSAKPANPMRIVWELSQRLPNNAIVTADSGSSTNWYARCLRFTDGVRGSVSGTLATMGCAVPYAIGAKFAHPDRPAIALVGDGAMQMNGMAELLTIRRFSRQWKDPRLIVCVFHNNDLNQVTWELRAMGGAPKFEPSQSLPDVSYAEVANAMGISGIAIDRDDDIGPAWDRALAADGPTVVDIRCDPEMPPIPPHATYEQIKELTTAILKGDPEALHLMYQGAKTKAQEFIPHRR